MLYFNRLVFIFPHSVPDPPMGIWVNQGSPSYFSLVATWTAPSTDQTVYSSYSLRLRPMDAAQASDVSVTVGADVTSYQFDGLLPETNYSVQVRTVSEGSGFTTMSSPREGYGRTGAYTPSG